MKQSAALAVRVSLCIMVLATFCLGQSKTVTSDQTTPGVAAVVNDHNITQAEVDSTAFSQLFALQQQIYAIRKAALENLISRALLDEESKRRRISVEELKQQLMAGKVEISSSQVDQLYSENASAFASMSPDEARLRLRLDLESQARMQNYREALSRLRAASQISWLMEEPRLPPISEVNVPTLGSQKALVTIVEFSDFQCPFCRNSQDAIKEVLKNYKSEVRLVFKHLPLDIHAQAFPAARAAFCAGEQGAFWPYHDALFLSEDLSSEALNTLATNIHLDLTKFGKCVESEPSRAAVQMDLEEARKFGINSTPTFVINGKLFRGALSYEELKTAVDEELKSHR